MQWFCSTIIFMPSWLCRKAIPAIRHVGDGSKKPVVGYAARTLRPSVSQHDLKSGLPAKINLIQSAVRTAYPTFLIYISVFRLCLTFGTLMFLVGPSSSLWKRNDAPRFFVQRTLAFSCVLPFSNAANNDRFGLMRWFCSTIIFLPYCMQLQ